MSQDAKQVAKEERKLIRLPMESDNGKVGITEEVLAVIAGIAAVDVEGVASINKNATRELIAKRGIKSIGGGVKVNEHDGLVAVNMILNLEYGAVAGEVSQKVQDKVKSTIENMTGLTVETVNVSVAGVAFPDNKTKS